MRPIEKELKVVADSSANNKRIDGYLSEIYNDYSRAFFQGLIRDNYIVVNDKPVKPSYRIKSGDIVKISFPEISPLEVSKIAEKYLKIIYEDNYILVIDKPAGVCVHPTGARMRAWSRSRRIGSNSLGEGERRREPMNEQPKANPRVGERAGIAKDNSEQPKVVRMRQDLTNLTIVDIISAKGIAGSVERYGIVHRLDKDTSGVMVIAKTPQAQYKLQKQFQDRQVKKTYLAIVHNSFSELSGSISAPLTRDIRDRKKFHIGFGKEAKTEFKVIKNFNNYAYLELHPITGRTHQIRVHLSSIGHPVLGDRLYSRCTEGEQIGVNRQMLHSYKLKIVHPQENKLVEFTANLPREFSTVLRAIRKLAVVVLSVFLLNSFVNVFAQTNYSQYEQLKSEIKKLNSRIDSLKSQANAISARLAEIQKQLKEHSEYQNRIKELNSAITELNRKLTVVESNFEDFKFSLKREKIQEEDKKSLRELRQSTTAEQIISSEIADKIPLLEAEMTLVRQELSRLQEKLGIEQAAKTHENKQKEEENTTVDKIKKFLLSPYAGATALGIALLALVIAVF